MSLFMQKLSTLARVFDAGAANKAKVRTRADASKTPSAQRAFTSKKWVIAGLR